MFSVYKYNIGADKTAIVNDIVSILTGNTDVGLLSTSCDKANSSIVVDPSRPAGWAIHDANAGSGKICIKSLNRDGTYKYVAICFVDINYLTLQTFESWNSATHIGTNVCFKSDTSNHNVTVSTANGGSFILSASEKAIFISTRTSAGLYYGPIAVCEFEKYEAWDTPALGIPSFGYIGSSFLNCTLTAGSNFQTPRVKNGVAADVTGTGAGYEFYDKASIPSVAVRDVNYLPAHRFTSAKLLSLSTHEYKIGGILYDIYATTKSFGGYMDEVTFDGMQYYIVSADAYRYAIPKF